MKKFRHGIVIGKFYPPHRGHKYLIDTALESCDRVTVLACELPKESIPVSLRAEWLRKIHPSANVRVVEGAMPGDDDSESWAAFTIQLLGCVPDAVFTSENYGHAYAR
jgi:HTH-type transcriptional regulator, transcriptional repressor of NAD biosynthesis genes